MSGKASPPSSTNLKILHVCTIPLTARAFVAPLARFLTARDYDVTIACSDDRSPESGASTIDQLRNEGFHIHVFPIARKIRPFSDLLAIWLLFRHIKEEEYTIVHAQTAKAGFVGRCAAKLARVPIIVYTAHAFPFHDELPAPLRWLYATLERLVARFTDRIIVDTNAIRDQGIRHRINTPERILTVNMGIDLSRFSLAGLDPRKARDELGIPSHAPVVGTVARLVPGKGTDCLLKSAARVVKVLPETRYLIVGDGPLRADLEALAERLGIRRNIIFTGLRSDVPRLLTVMDVFVLPTLREGFGVVVAEAMAMQKAVVVSKIGPLEEVVVDGETGTLVHPDDDEQFAQATLSMLRDEQKRRAMGLAARKRVEACFDEQSMFEKIEATYKQLLAEKGLV